MRAVSSSVRAIRICLDFEQLHFSARPPADTALSLIGRCLPTAVLVAASMSIKQTRAGRTGAAEVDQMTSARSSGGEAVEARRPIQQGRAGAHVASISTERPSVDVRIRGGWWRSASRRRWGSRRGARGRCFRQHLEARVIAVHLADDATGRQTIDRSRLGRPVAGLPREARCGDRPRASD